MEKHEGISYFSNLTYYEARVDKPVYGHLKENEIFVLSFYGYYDEEKEAWIDKHPSLIPYKEGQKCLALLVAGSYYTGSVGYGSSLFFSGELQEFEGERYAVYRTMVDTPAEEIAKVMPEGAYQVVKVPVSETQSRELVIIKAEVMAKILKEKLSEKHGG